MQNELRVLALILLSALTTLANAGVETSQGAKLSPRFPLGLKPAQSPDEVTTHLKQKGLELKVPISDDSPGNGQGMWSLSDRIKFDNFDPTFLMVRFFSPDADEPEKFLSTVLVQTKIENCSSVEGVYRDAVKFLRSNYNFDGAKIVDSEKLFSPTCLDYVEYGRVAWGATTPKWWIFATTKQDHDGTFEVEVSYDYRPVSDEKIQNVNQENTKDKAATKSNL